MKVTEDMYDFGKKVLSYWSKFDDIYTNRKTEFLIALGYCYLLDSVENEKVVRKVHQNPRAFNTISSITDAIDVLEDVYNQRCRNHIYIENEYFRYLDSISASVLSHAIISKREARNKAALIAVTERRFGA